MNPPEELHRYREQIGAFLLGELDRGERTAMQTHLNSCPVCQAEVRELEPVVAALANAAPDRIDEDPLPPGDLEESTLAPILGEIHRARRRRRQFQWSALAAAAICVFVVGLAGFYWLLGPEVRVESEFPLEPLSFSGEAPGVEVEGDLIAHPWGTEIRLDV
jgi:anti-sigma factor RsiW